MADRAGLHQESVACIEDGRSVPCLDIVNRISFALGMKFSLHGDEQAANETPYRYFKEIPALDP